MKIFNSLSKQKEPFEPLEVGKVRLYVCGMTVYDYCHIGHARSMVIFDMVVRYLRARGLEVTYVRNITDVDDKIINRANENKEDSDALTERFIQALHEDEKALGLLSPDQAPRATDFIPEIIALIETLVDQGHAYVADSGDVCFDVRKFKPYGQLSNRDIDQLMAGVRVEISEKKKDPLDFVLWKPAKPDEPAWDSPWGKGRPGWHIECSAMSTKLLGQPFDIHGGGLDLKFPHHENEKAQSEAACGKDFVKRWMHVGLLQVDGEKMSKSLNNFYTIREVLEKHHPEVIRYFMMSGHYRSPVSYSEDTLSKVTSSLGRLYVAIRGLPKAKPTGGSFEEKFHAVMDDDFNTPKAFSVLFDMAHEINRLREQGATDKAAGLAAALKEWAGIFGLLQEDPEVFLKGGADSADVAQIEALIAERNKAREEKNWAEADRVRDELNAMDVVIEDAAKGTTWRKESD